MTDSPRSIADVIRLPTGPVGAFASTWEAYTAVGLAAYPKDATEKKSAVTLPRKRPGTATLREWASGQFRTAGVVIRTGRISGLTVVDVDTHGKPERVPDLVRKIEALCGPTPIKVSTPSGGCHLWYRFNGEASRTPQGRKRDQLPVDLRGERGIVVAPPTVTDKGVYSFIAGDVADVPSLPKIKAGAVALLYGDKVAAPADEGRGRLREGDGRNSALYPHLCEAALMAVSKEGFLREAERLNAAMCADPLPALELLKAAAGIWKRKMGDGPPLYPHVAEPYATFTMTDWQRYGSDPYNVGLLVMARLHHRPGKPFAVSARGMTRSPFFHGWARHRIEKATAFLAGPGGAFRQVKKGGRGAGDAAQYELLPTLSAALPEQRADTGLVPTGGTNRTNHPPPPQGKELARQTARGPAREQARRMAQPNPFSQASQPLPQSEAQLSPRPNPNPIFSPSNLHAAPSAPGGSDPGTSMSAVMISNTPKPSSESGGAKISAPIGRQTQLDLVEYLGGDPRPAPLDPREVYEFLAYYRLSQRALARLADIPPGSLFPWLRGNQPLTPENEASLRRAMTLDATAA